MKMEGSQSFMQPQKNPKVEYNEILEKLANEMFDRARPIKRKSEVKDAVLYALDVKGPSATKASRSRPILTQVFAKHYENPFENQVKIASASVEAHHSASLILDDLKCMDDAFYRRGRLTTHLEFTKRALGDEPLFNHYFNQLKSMRELQETKRKVADEDEKQDIDRAIEKVERGMYELRLDNPTLEEAIRSGESTSIMASQMLVNIGSGIVKEYIPAPYTAELFGESTNVGNVMILAQELDLNQKMSSKKEIKEMYMGKSGELFGFAVRLGTFHRDGSVKGSLNDWPKEKTYEFGRQLGFVYQIADDIKDYVQTTEEMGKDAGRDVGKVTYYDIGANPQGAVKYAQNQKRKLIEYVQGNTPLEKLLGAKIEIPEIK